MRRLLMLLVLLLGACASPESIVKQPTSARPQPAAQTRVNQGAIYQPASARPLFEEPVARRVGDVVVIVIEESLSAVNKANSSNSRTGGMEFGTSGNIPFLPIGLEKFISRDTGVSVNSSLSNAGKGETNTSNTFSGTITTSVTEVLSNGNLILGGEKQVSVGGQVSILRFSGMVSPTDIKAGNTVSSKRVADARIEQVGKGVMADANTTGWLQRLFYSVWPF